MSEENLLDQIFSVSDEEIETFADVLEKENMSGSFSPKEVCRLSRTANYAAERQGFIEINHGTHENHYVWHIKPWHAKKPWSVPIGRVIYAIAKVLNAHFPQDVIIDLYPPSDDWDIPEITVRANEAANNWSVDEYCLKKVTGQFFEVLGSLV